MRMGRIEKRKMVSFIINLLILANENIICT